jgi:hypothetical protein
VSRHRKSSILYVSQRCSIHRGLVSHEPHVLYSCPRSILPFSCLERCGLPSHNATGPSLIVSTPHFAISSSERVFLRTMLMRHLSTTAR